MILGEYYFTVPHFQGQVIANTTRKISRLAMIYQIQRVKYSEQKEKSEKAMNMDDYHYLICNKYKSGKLFNVANHLTFKHNGKTGTEGY